MGQEFHVREWGEKNGTTALLIHGVADGGFVWEDFATALAGHCRVVALDLRGHGNSQHDPDHVYTLARFVSDVRQLIEQLQLEDVVLIGHSMGGDIAANIAPGLQDKLRALVVVDSGPGEDAEIADYLHHKLMEAHRPYASVDDYANLLRDQRQLADEAALSRIAKEALRLCPDGHYWPKCDPAVLDIVTADCDDSWWLPALERIAAPILIVRGLASSTLSRRMATRMVGAAKTGEFAEVPRSGHAVMTDNPEGFRRAVVPFVARALASAS